MENVIIIRYAEIHLKGKNRYMFENALLSNIKSSLKGIYFTLTKMHGRELITGYGVDNEIEIMNRLAKVAGIHSFSKGVMFPTSKDIIKAQAEKFAKAINGTFKVKTNRADKTFAISSSEYSAIVGGYILDVNPNLKVDLYNPAHIFDIDIREEGVAFIYTNTTNGVGGMPVGTAGRGLLLLSGGIDSPVAGYMACKRGVKLSALHFESPPYTNEGARQKVMNLAKKICAYNGKTKVYVVSTTKIQEEIHSKCNAEFGITLLRRFMLKIAERIAMEDKYQMLVTGESLGQVASQTIESMTTIGEVITENLPIIKPLICFDKEETVTLAKKIDTYEISIQPYADCCTVFLPKSPATKPNLKKVMREETRLNVEELIGNAMKEIKIIEIE